MRRLPSPRLFTSLCVLLLALALGACARAPRPGESRGAEAVVSGTVTYRPRIALPPDAVVRVRLDDVSRADTPATVAEQTIATGGRQVPIPFALRVDQQRIHPDGRYVVRAEIRGGAEGLLWTTRTPPSVPAPGTPAAPPVEVVVVQAENEADGAGAHGAGAATGPLVGPDWRLARIELADGRLVTPAAREAYTIAFDSSGRYNGQAHCNRYGGEYRAVASGSLELRQGLSTLAACAPPSSANAFVGVLNGVTGFAVTGDELRLTSGPRGALVFRRTPGG